MIILHGFNRAHDESHKTSTRTYQRYMDKVKDQHQNGFDIRDPFAAQLMRTQSVQEARELAIKARQDVVKDVHKQIRDRKRDIENLSRNSSRMTPRQRNRLEDKIFEPIEPKKADLDITQRQKGIANMATKYKPF